MSPNTSACSVAPHLDAVSSRVVRRELTRLMKTKWDGYWVPAMNMIDRDKLAWNLERRLRSYWMARDGEPIYSREAIAREVDWYLPKTFWHLKRKRKGPVRSVVIDVDGKTFSQWRFEYGETRERLRDECARRVEEIESYKKRQAAVVYDRETGEVIEAAPKEGPM